MKENKDKFKVYTNTNMPEKTHKEEINVELEVPNEDTLTGLFVTSPYFMEMIMSQDYFYYPVDVEAEESLMAPILHKGVLQDFMDNTELFCKREGIPAAALLHIAVEDEDQEMIPLFQGPMQIELMKFFRTTVAIMNQDLALEEEFDEIFEELINELEGNGYLDTTLTNVLEYMSERQTMEYMLFPEEE